jgi:C4-dicarboxylate transporter, DctQ subunit
MDKFIRLVNRLSTIGGYAGAVCVGLAIGMIMVHIFARRVLGTPLLFGEEVCMYLMLAIVFLGLGHTMQTGGHVRVDLVLSKVSRRAQVVLDKLCTCLATLFTLVFLIGNCLVVKQFYVRHTISTMDLKVPLVIPGMFMVIGSLLLLLQLLARLFSREVSID